MSLILASASPRRRDLLREAGLEFAVTPANVDEDALAGETAPDHVRRLARAKARQVAQRSPEDIVLGADTIVFLNGRIFGKPASRCEAVRMLSALSGAAHEVLTGVCICRGHPQHEEAWVSRTIVQFRTLAPELIERYCSLVDPLDKAGAYAIQEHGEMLISHIHGLRSNVIGLPVEEVLERLKRL